MNEPIPTWQTLPPSDVVLPLAKLPVFDQMLLEERQEGDDGAAIIRLAREALKDIETVFRLWPYPHFKLSNLQMLRLVLSAQRVTGEHDE